jgi:peptide/nickel transport system permease protein/oligopeptide transport system permease protein
MFVDRLVGYAQGDFGQNFNGRPVLDLVAEAAPVTLRLTLLAILMEAIVGVTAGVLAGLRKERFIDNLVRVSTVLLISVPIFVLGVLLQIGAGLKVGLWLRDRGAPDWLQAVFSVTYTDDYPWLSLTIPAVVLGSLSLGFIARLTRTSLIEAMRSDYVRTARAKGLKPSRVAGIHALRNSLIPVLTYIGIDVGALMGGALVTEGIFNIPGIGGLTFGAVRQSDTTVILGVVPLLVLVFLVTSLLVDLLYAVLDPRIRYD